MKQQLQILLGSFMRDHVHLSMATFLAMVHMSVKKQGTEAVNGSFESKSTLVDPDKKSEFYTCPNCLKICRRDFLNMLLHH